MDNKTKKIALISSVPALAIGWALFRPELLFVNNSVSEKLVVTNGEKIENISMGKFESFSHETTGKATIVMVGENAILRLSDFHTSNGPDVHVILNKNNDPKSFTAETSIDLGVIKGNVGDQNYKLPNNLKIKEFNSVTIWCKRFAVSFGGAKLNKNSMVSKPNETSSNGSNLQSTFVQLSRFGGSTDVIRVLSGKIVTSTKASNGTIELIETGGKRFLKVSNFKSTEKTADVYFVKKETLGKEFNFDSLTRVKVGQWVTGKKVQQFPVSKELDAWLYRSAIVWNPTSKKALGTSALRSDQELQRKNNNI